jgi:hypothetical protein
LSVGSFELLLASISILVCLLEARLLPEATPRLSENLTYFLDAEAVVFCAFIVRYCETVLGAVLPRRA